MIALQSVRAFPGARDTQQNSPLFFFCLLPCALVYKAATCSVSSASPRALVPELGPGLGTSQGKPECSLLSVLGGTWKKTQTFLSFYAFFPAMHLKLKRRGLLVAHVPAANARRGLLEVSEEDCC